ncbi:MAG TPA: hypothetical protein VE990_03370 [Acidimicrobiales bacterium]|nr:hypothetical protein [Acidimicrobiales bacterium]
MSRHPNFAPVRHLGVDRYPPGAEATEWRPGDFLLTHRQALLSRFIRVCQRRMLSGEDKEFAFWSHAALVVSTEGELIEAVHRGVQRVSASEYRDVEYRVVHVDADDHDRAEAVAFAEWAAASHQRFGHLTMVSILFTVATGSRLSFELDGTEICSGLVARAEERTGAIFDRDPTHVMPADLARYYDVRPPARPMELSLP